MRLRISDPDYVYRPLPEAQKRRMSLVARRRRGIPDGFRQVFGAWVDEEHADEVRRAMMHFKGCKARRAP